MIKKGLRFEIAARTCGVLALILFPISSVIVVCHDNCSEFKKFYNDCLDMIFLRDTDNW